MSEIEGEKKELKKFIKKEKDKLKTARSLQKEFANNDELREFYGKKVEEYKEAIETAKKRRNALIQGSEEGDESD